MNVLLIGGGGREHALAWAIAKSEGLTRLYAAPGNPGIAAHATCIDVPVSDHSAVVAFAKSNDVALVIIGPEAPLVAGLADDLTAAGISVFGPAKAAAQLEGSKGFTKDFCAKHNIPTAAYGRFADAESAIAFAAEQSLPVVIKADGLAAGKGVVIAATRDEADAAIRACFDGAFGAAGSEVVVEAFLEGEEASFFVLCDGETILPLATAQDHKRVGDGDTGPNTGGMGAYSPAPVMTDALITETLERIIKPTVAGMAAAGTPFRGVLYAGLMITARGPELIEYNVRFGDPEAQVLVMRLKSDLLPALKATADGALAGVSLAWHDAPALTVVMAAAGYPGEPRKGDPIRGLDGAAATSDTVVVFHAGTRADGDTIVANGGRVLAVTARGATFSDAQARAYGAVKAIDWPTGFCRSDIGYRAIARERGSSGT